MAFGWPIVGVVLHMIIEIWFLVERFWTMWTTEIGIKPKLELLFKKKRNRDKKKSYENPGNPL